MISELQDDLQLMTSALGGAWWVTPNERRDLMNFPADETVPEFDDYFVPMGLTPLSERQDPAVDNTALTEAEKRLNLNDYGR
jgi:hypothetical protein